MLATTTSALKASKVYRWTKISKEEINSLPTNSVWAVYFILKMFMGSNGVAYPSASTIAEIAGCSVKSVRRATKELLDRGLIVRDGFDHKNQTARFKLPKAQKMDTPNLGEGTPNLSTGGTPNLSTEGTPNLSTNKEKENKEKNKKEPNPFYLVPRID